MKEGEKLGKYLDLARELKSSRDMKGKRIPNLVGALGTVPKKLENRYDEEEIK